MPDESAEIEPGRRVGEEAQGEKEENPRQDEADDPRPDPIKFPFGKPIEEIEDPPCNHKAQNPHHLANY
jgi:hypothetical protein